MHNMKLLGFLLALLAPTMAFADTTCSANVPVTMQLSSEITSTVPSASIGIYALMQNTSEEILSGASLAVDVLSPEGAVVDRFSVEQPITIFAKSSAKIGFVWKVPSSIESGTYTVQATYAPPGATRAAAFAHRLYPSAALRITVQGGVQGGVRLLSLSVNAQPYTAWTVAPFSQGRLSATADAGNEGAAPYIGTVTWRVFGANAKLADAPLSEGTSSVELHPGKSESVSYDLPTSADAYYVEGEFHDGRSLYFDMLLDRGTGAFPWASCKSATAPRTAGFGTPFFIAIALVLLAIIAFAAFEYRRHRA